MSVIPVPFDPVELFGQVRAPVVVTLGGYSYRSTICRMRGETFIPLSKRNRDGAALAPDAMVSVVLTLDRAPRTVDCPDDLAQALQAAGLNHVWAAQSFTAQREQADAVIGAVKPATRQRRIHRILSDLSKS